MLAASADAAGRSFPLALFADLSAAAARETLPALPAAYEPFLRDASTLLSSAPSHDGAEVTRGVEALAGGPAPLAEPHGWKNEPVSGLLTSALGGAPKALAYALHTLVTACDRAADGAATAANALTVEAPARGSATIALWLAIARHRLGWREAAPSLLWTGEPDGRLLITLGPPFTCGVGLSRQPQAPQRAPVAVVHERCQRYRRGLGCADPPATAGDRGPGWLVRRPG